MSEVLSALVFSALLYGFVFLQVSERKINPHTGFYVREWWRIRGAGTPHQ